VYSYIFSLKLLSKCFGTPFMEEEEMESGDSTLVFPPYILGIIIMELHFIKDN
jgi:hypothetical protein